MMPLLPACAFSIADNIISEVSNEIIDAPTLSVTLGLRCRPYLPTIGYAMRVLEAMIHPNINEAMMEYFSMLTLITNVKPNGMKHVNAPYISIRFTFFFTPSISISSAARNMM